MCHFWLFDSQPFPRILWYGRSTHLYLSVRPSNQHHPQSPAEELNLVLSLPAHLLMLVCLPNPYWSRTCSRCAWAGLDLSHYRFKKGTQCSANHSRDVRKFSFLKGLRVQYWNRKGEEEGLDIRVEGFPIFFTWIRFSLSRVTDTLSGAEEARKLLSEKAMEEARIEKLTFLFTWIPLGLESHSWLEDSSKLKKLKINRLSGPTPLVIQSRAIRSYLIQGILD